MDVLASFALVEVADQDNRSIRLLCYVSQCGEDPVDDLRKAMIKRGVRESFTESDEKLFKAFVDHAVIWSKEKVQFHFTCGLVAEEDMRVEKVGRSYTEVPVRTEFDEQRGAFTWQ